jgi:hypothetical protein
MTTVREAAKRWIDADDAMSQASSTAEKFALLVKCGDAKSALRKALEADTVEVPRMPSKTLLAAMVEANAEHEDLVQLDGLRRSERVYRALIAAASQPETGK